MTDTLSIAEGLAVLDSAGRDFRLHRFERQDAAAGWLAEALAADLHQAISARGIAILSGAGGSTPRPVYERLAEASVAWDKVVVTEVDERFVPVDDASSNTRMMTQALKPAIDQGLRFVTLTQNDTDQDACAREAEAALRALNGGNPPVFDVTLLGMGEDAHYASIFPEHSINDVAYDTDDLILSVTPAVGGIEPKLPRLTQSVAQINRSRRLILYITGTTKLRVLNDALVANDYVKAPIGAYLNQCPVPIDIVWSA